MKTLFGLLCCAFSVFGGVVQPPKPIVVAGILGLELAPVTDPAHIELGYSCKSRLHNLGPMSDGEVRRNFSPTICAEVKCLNGTLAINGCDPVLVHHNCKIIEDRWRDYPDCCHQVECPTHT